MTETELLVGYKSASPLAKSSRTLAKACCPPSDCAIPYAPARLHSSHGSRSRKRLKDGIGAAERLEDLVSDLPDRVSFRCPNLRHRIARSIEPVEGTCLQGWFAGGGEILRQAKGALSIVPERALF
jgi:hypothetical protein